MKLGLLLNKHYYYFRSDIAGRVKQIFLDISEPIHVVLFNKGDPKVAPLRELMNEILQFRISQVTVGGDNSETIHDLIDKVLIEDIGQTVKSPDFTTTDWVSTLREALEVAAYASVEISKEEYPRSVVIVDLGDKSNLREIRKIYSELRKKELKRLNELGEKGQLRRK